MEVMFRTRLAAEGIGRIEGLLGVAVRESVCVSRHDYTKGMIYRKALGIDRGGTGEDRGIGEGINNYVHAAYISETGGGDGDSA